MNVISLSAEMMVPYQTVVEGFDGQAQVRAESANLLVTLGSSGDGGGSSGSRRHVVRSFARMGVAVLVVLSSVTACSGRSTQGDPYPLAAKGLCAAAASAVAGDVAGAESHFYDTAHQPLHDLAAEVSEIDRVLAARLLEAKEAVESGLEEDQVEMGDAFRSLIGAVNESLTAAGHDPTPCGSDESA